jgi:hypothetical protein
VSEALEYTKIVSGAVLSWPVVFVVVIYVFREPLHALFAATAEYRISKLRVGGLTVELNELRREGKEAVDRFNQLSLLMAESRIIEWEITAQTVGALLPADKVAEMEKKLDRMRELVVEDAGSAPATPKVKPPRGRPRRPKPEETDIG